MKIIINKPKYTMIAIQRELNKKELDQLSRQIEKYILRTYSVLTNSIEIK